MQSLYWLAAWQHSDLMAVLLQQPGNEDGNEDDVPEDRMDIIQEGEDSMEGRARTVAERITTRYLTKYERARVLGTRALQLR